MQCNNFKGIIFMAKQNYKLHLKGYVGGWDFDSDYVDFVLNKNVDNEVHVLIDSLGGSLATALSIVAAFRNHGNVHVHYVGMNASAATIASLGAKHVSIDASAMYLVHKCSMEFFKWASANADKLQDIINEAKQMKADLDKMDSNIAQMYASKCKKEPKDLLALMKKGGWLTAKEALEWGFVDEITDFEEDAAPLMTDSIAADMHANGIPVPSINETSDTRPLYRFFETMANFFRGSAVDKQDINNEKTENTMTNETTKPQGEETPNANALAEKDAKITELQNELNALKAENEALKKAPGDTTTNIADTKPNGGEPQQKPSAVEDFFNTRQRSQALYNILP